MSVDLARQALWTTLLLAGPLLGAGLLAGLLVSVFQAVTQIQEVTLTFLPKLLASILILIVLGPWMLRVMVEFTQGFLAGLARFAG
jgi:flagellar biosynthetic protein FliQ